MGKRCLQSRPRGPAPKGTVGEIVDTLDRDKVDTFSSVPCYGFLVFFLKTSSRRGGNVGISRVLRDFQGAVERWESVVCFSTFPTAPSFPSPVSSEIRCQIQDGEFVAVE
jgi:hypothetical protein